MKLCACTQAEFEKQQRRSRVGSASMEKGKKGWTTELKKKKRYTYTFSDSMVLQKVLMATRVEQHEFVFWFNFLKNCVEGIWKKKQQKCNHKSSFFPFVSTCANSHSDLSSTVQHLRPEIGFLFFFTFLWNQPANFSTKIVKSVPLK